MGVIMHNNIPYGGGSTVEPNPQESATEQLETLGIDGDVYEVTDANAIHTSDVGVANGVAELDANGFVPSSQLPSYVDDVLEYASRSAFPATGETGKIYVALDTNLTYRWGGSDYVEISPSLALGETSSTAYRGDRGKIAYDHSQSDHSGIKPAFTEASTRANIASGESFATLLGKIKKFFSDLKTVAFTGAYSDLSGTPTIPTVNDATLTIQKNGTAVETFTANSSTNKTANITVPTKTSDLNNDSDFVDTTDLDTKVSKSGDLMTGTLCVEAGTGNYDEGIRINKGHTNYSTLLMGAPKGSKAGRQDGTWWIGTNPDLQPRKLMIAHNGSTETGTYFHASASNQQTPALRLGASGSVASGDNDAVNGDAVYNYIINNGTFLPLAGGNMTGAGGIQYPTAAGNNKASNFISAGGGYSAGSGKSGVKIICCEQSDCISGLGQDCSGLSGGYEFNVIAGANNNNGNCYISFLSHKSSNPSVYTRLGYFNGSGDLYVTKDVYATNFRGALIGNADTATQATKDGDGNTISSTYAKKPLYATGSVSSGKTGVQKIAQITLSEVGTYYITGWAKFTGGGKKAVQLWCAGTLGESWEDSTIATGEPKTFSTFAIYTSTVANEDVKVNSYTVSASNAVTGGIVAFKIA